MGSSGVGRCARPRRGKRESLAESVDRSSGIRRKLSTLVTSANGSHSVIWTAVLPLLERDREQFIQRRLLERRLRTIIPGPISRGNGRFRVHHCLPNCLKASARLKAQGPRTFATTSSERDDGFCKMTPKRQLGQPSLSPYGHPRAAVPQYRRDITWRNDHEKAQYAWDRRWCRVIGCGALLASMVPRECGPCGATANVVTC